MRLAFAGDVHFMNALRARLDADPATAMGPFARETLSAADLAMVNLETAVTDRGSPVPKAYNFRAPATAFDALRAAGVDVVTQANNHGMDYGLVGLQDSLAAARQHQFPVVGIGADEDSAYAPRRFTVNGQRVAVLGATGVIDDALIPSWTAGPGQPGLASAYRLDRLAKAVTDARSGADLVVVYMHWSREGSDCPTDFARTVERTLVDAGADVIVGAHTHVLLGNGWDPKGPFVDYGLGNFVFYASGSGPTTETGVLLLDVTGRRVTAAQWVPARIQGGIPVRQTGGAGQGIVDALRSCTGLLSSPPPGGAG